MRPSADPARCRPDPEPLPSVKAEAERVSDRVIGHRTARRGLWITLDILLLTLACTHFQQIWKFATSVAMAWPDWVYHWPGKGLLPF